MKIMLPVADTPWKRAKGLMFKKKPQPLLLVFDKPGYHGIWMLGTRFSIDLVFLDSERRVVDIFEGIKPISWNPKTWRIYRPSKPVKYALELPEGEVRNLEKWLERIKDITASSTLSRNTPSPSLEA